MSLRIAIHSITALAFDPDAIAEALMETCNRRSLRYNLRGVCPVDDKVFFLLEPRAASAPSEQYVIVPVSDTTEDGVTGMLNERWGAGFGAIGTVPLGEDTCLFVFAKPMDPAR